MKKTILMVLTMGFFSCALEPLVNKNGNLVMNEQFFQKEILSASPRLQQKPVHLIGFIDANHDCPACLQELFQWVFHLEKDTLFDLTIFVKNNIAPSELDALLDSLGLSSEKIILFEEGDPAAGLNKYGPFKVIYAPERGILWYGPTMSDPKEHLAFKDRLGEVLRELEH